MRGQQGEGPGVHRGRAETHLKAPDFLAFRHLTLSVLSSWILFANPKWGKILVTL